jgi:hypothetical protein
LGGRGFSPGANHPKTILPPIPFSALTHAPVISTGMNDSFRFSLRGWPILSSRVSSRMACPPRQGGFFSPSAPPTSSASPRKPPAPPTASSARDLRATHLCHPEWSTRLLCPEPELRGRQHDYETAVLTGAPFDFDLYKGVCFELSFFIFDFMTTCTLRSEQSRLENT